MLCTYFCNQNFNFNVIPKEKTLKASSCNYFLLLQVFTEFPKAKTVSTIKPKQNDEFIYDKGCALDLQTSYGQSFTKHPQATRHAVRYCSCNKSIIQ